jgi:hypothetical protein
MVLTIVSVYPLKKLRGFFIASKKKFIFFLKSVAQLVFSITFVKQNNKTMNKMTKLQFAICFSGIMGMLITKNILLPWMAIAIASYFEPKTTKK